MTGRHAEDLLRDLAPRVLGAVVRRYGNFALAEDAVQEALLAAATRWPAEGEPRDPRGWLITVASRRLTDLLRAEQARRRREDQVAQWTISADRLAPAADEPQVAADDTLVLLFLCCHPELSTASQIALTLRAVGGLTTAEIARAFLVPESTMTRRITRAKQTIADSGARFRMPDGTERAGRLSAVLHVLYLIFNEGYASTSSGELQRVELATEAIRLARTVHKLVPDDGEVSGLLALMLLTDARSPARATPDGALIPMSEQDRSLWRADAIAEGTELITRALPVGPTGPYQLQAAIAALHDEAASAEDTDWAQIKALYELLLRIWDNPMVELNHAVAVAMADGEREGLRRLEELRGRERLAGDYRLSAVRAHLLERLGEKEAAREEYLAAARRATNRPQQRYLRDRAAGLSAH
ncbi:RNA polymerase sigma factor [Stackebrandtia nassauensis]|uniref:Putative RNA polymerase, sigma-24 subunit, ECF subfamily n=1 Tax=Stackebrandtia nassauensis (strain DSM 44728 / CIP 108903 / NRRL B-16338 / NBRC 102104 / LLR-40K-21) TaxID=446470 RepID=D3Q7Q9_STANL|nr:sigma-70 family RNA polymerase sigma factor [Stackebrandtia nassauensis]ADD44401.1 putative RNA polymerase, sigma-24 subunit, ECF subfamily [Stackebrandtia nassauensis DSM 44728]